MIIDCIKWTEKILALGGLLGGQMDAKVVLRIAYSSSCAKNISAFFDEIRYHVDKLEHLVDDDKWTLPKYREMLFLR